MNTMKLTVVKEKLFLLFRRSKSSLGLWDENISSEIKHKIENHWANEVLHNEQRIKSTHYVLPMFPYPSGNLHMGHVRVYSISDTIARTSKLQGKNVIHPIGWDAFGLPAENAAIEHNIAPQDWTASNIENMKKQLMTLGINFDWDREINTSDPKYYKWTQYIFLKLFDNGLVYQSKAKVNWDPVDQTVLADEQVDDSGCSWRSGAKVEKKTLTQWFIKTTKFAKSLYDGLDSTSLENWKDIINLQKHWIGECNGVVINFAIKFGNNEKDIEIWTADPYKVIHGEYLVISKHHVALQDLSKEEVATLKCYNPLTDSEMRIYVTDEVNYPEGREVYISCPSVDAQDRELSMLLNIPCKGTQILDINIENEKATTMALDKKFGGYFVSSKLKDWLISRQRYWGTPIPIIHCPKCGIVPTPYEDLPVVLPQEKSSNEPRFLSLSNFESWLHCKCPKCSGHAQRETDTMDTFVDSSWYYYRFLDPHNGTLPFEKDNLKTNIPVHCYIGGKEHAVLHLYYARFMSYFLHSIGLSPSKEPFKKLLVQGMVMGESYKLKSSGKYLHPESIIQEGNQYKDKITGEPVLAQWEKMSKSKYNGENPQRLISKYGCDTTRLMMLADVPPETTRKWSDATLPGVLNWQHRLWLTIRDLLKHRNSFDLKSASKLPQEKFKEIESHIRTTRNFVTATATYHIVYTHKFSVGISRLQSLTSVLRNNLPPEIIATSKEYENALAALIIMLSPVMPHFGSELWSGFVSAPNKLGGGLSIDWERNVLEQTWPTVDRNYPLSLQCKVDGAELCDLKVEASILQSMSAEDVLQEVLKNKTVAKRVRSGIHKTKYELYPECRGILYIYTQRRAKEQKTSLENKTQVSIA